jgi:hypothetical protein
MKNISLCFLFIVFACNNKSDFYEAAINTKLNQSNIAINPQTNNDAKFLLELYVQLYGGEKQTICLEKSKLPIIGTIICQKDSNVIAKRLCGELKYDFSLMYQNNQLTIIAANRAKKLDASITYQVKGIKRLAGHAETLPLGLAGVLFARCKLEVEAYDKTKYSGEEIIVRNNDLFVKWSQRSGELNFSIYLDLNEWFAKLPEQQPYELPMFSKPLNLNLLEGYEPHFFVIKKRFLKPKNE